MNRLNPSDLFQFSKRYRLAGGKLRGLRIRIRGGIIAIAFAVVVRTAIRDLGTGSKPARLKFRLKGVEEYRFQKRPSGNFGQVNLTFANFQGLIYINFESMNLASGETPGIQDFRISDAFVAASEVFWAEV